MAYRLVQVARSSPEPDIGRVQPLLHIPVDVRLVRLQCRQLLVTSEAAVLVPLSVAVGGDSNDRDRLQHDQLPPPGHEEMLAAAPPQRLRAVLAASARRIMLRWQLHEGDMDAGMAVFARPDRLDKEAATLDTAIMYRAVASAAVNRLHDRHRAVLAEATTLARRARLRGQQLSLLAAFLQLRRQEKAVLGPGRTRRLAGIAGAGISARGGGPPPPPPPPPDDDGEVAISKAFTTVESAVDSLGSVMSLGRRHDNDTEHADQEGTKALGTAEAARVHALFAEAVALLGIMHMTKKRVLEN